MEKLRQWLARKALGAITNIDYSLQPGDLVNHSAWKHGPVEVVDINWALRSMAVQLNPKNPESIVVWSVWGAQKI